MDKICKDIICHIGNFLTCTDLLSLSLINKQICSYINAKILDNRTKYKDFMDRLAFAEELSKHTELPTIWRDAVILPSKPVYKPDFDIFGNFSFSQKLRNIFEARKQTIMDNLDQACEDGSLLKAHLNKLNDSNVTDIRIRHLYWRLGYLWSIHDIYYKDGKIKTVRNYIFYIELNIGINSIDKYIELDTKSYIFPDEFFFPDGGIDDITREEALAYITYIFNQCPIRIIVPKKSRILDTTLAYIMRRVENPDNLLKSTEEKFRPLV